MPEKFPNEDGYELWLRYIQVDDDALLASYRASITQVCFEAGASVGKAELLTGLAGLLGAPVPLVDHVTQDGTLLISTSPPDLDLSDVGDEGYVIQQMPINNFDCILIAANTDRGVLYGVFAFLRLLQTQQTLHDLNITCIPKIKLRMLNHWDNLDGTIERGYAGYSLWDWHKLPHYIEPRYRDYARANASIGINAVSLTNVNANALVLSHPYLVKVAALADVFRPYGIQVFLTARFSAPQEMGGLSTSDPLDMLVIVWWETIVADIYDLIPDFGGFVVKANSEGQPGPHDYGRSHSEGANMLANALAPYGGTVVWRAFVYDAGEPDDRHKQAYTELVPQDGTFRENVFLQVKNGAIDFQPREPFHPLFGAMPQTPLMLEVQLTQEYLGCATHLAYLAPMFKETLDSDTYTQGEGSLVAHVVDGMAAVTNIGDERNWCGHPFAASNWYAFGRLAWDHRLTSEAIAEEWLRMTFSNQAEFVQPAKPIMLASRAAIVDYMTPLGLHHIMARNHHYGPAPWVTGGRADWTSVYYHQADVDGIGFDRSPTGSNAISQYCAPYREIVGNVETCPEELLLWFHHVAWTHRMNSGRTLWDELCFCYQRGVETVRQWQQTWETLATTIDAARFEHVRALLAIQEREACWWRDACLLYFQTFSGMPISHEQPTETLAYYMSLSHYYVPGIPERRFER